MENVEKLKGELAILRDARCFMRKAHQENAKYVAGFSHDMMLAGFLAGDKVRRAQDDIRDRP